VILIAGLILLTGCSLLNRQIVLHPITPNDIFRIEKGTKIEDKIVQKDGYFLSDEYLEEVAKARIGR